MIIINAAQARRIFVFLITADLILLGFYVLTNAAVPVPSWTLRHWFDLDSEGNIPTWFSSCLLLFSAVTCVACAMQSSRRRLQRCYVLAAAGFAFLSADETAQIHEGIAHIAAKMTIAQTYFPHLPQLWMYIYPIAAIVLACVFYREIKSFLQETAGRQTFFIGVVIYIGGALGLEAVDVFLIPDSHVILHFIEVCFEETCEMIGATTLFYSFLLKLTHMRLPEAD